MKNLAPLSANFSNHFIQISSAKSGVRKTRLDGMHSIINNAYATYIPDIATLCSLTPISLTNEQADDLRHCYIVETQPLRDLKCEIENNILNKDPIAYAICQYCGLTHSPDTWDHYLPKEKYPEFSIHAYNLVPTCDRCNNLKGAKLKDKSGCRMAINLYFDVLPITSYLNTLIKIAPRPSAQFSLSINPADFGGLEQEIRNHYKNLKLLKRYGKAAAGELEDMRSQLRDTVKCINGIGLAKKILEKKCNQMTLSHSINFWKVSLYKAMACSLDFLNWCAK